jgi:hypothetical protein
VTDPKLHPFGHESAAIDTRRVLRLGAILAASVLGITAGLYLLLQLGIMPRYAQRAALRAAIPPAPRLQAHPVPDLAAVRAAEQVSLSEYRWLDPAHSAAQIPIARAMELYVRQRELGTDKEPRP